MAQYAPSEITFLSLGDEVQLPVNCANTSTTMTLSPYQRWVLWVDGPLRGPAVRLWALLGGIIAIGFMLGRVRYSPLKTHQWILLLIGLTQIPYLASFFAVGWFFLVSLKKLDSLKNLSALKYNAYQLVLIGGTLLMGGILLYALHSGLLGSPEMRIVGERSSTGHLKWFQARGNNEILPIAKVVSVSIWFYRALMLLWAVWLAFSVLKWAHFLWIHFNDGGAFKPLKPSKSSQEKNRNSP